MQNFGGWDTRDEQSDWLDGQQGSRSRKSVDSRSCETNTPKDTFTHEAKIVDHPGLLLEQRQAWRLFPWYAPTAVTPVIEIGELVHQWLNTKRDCPLTSFNDLVPPLDTATFTEPGVVEKWQEVAREIEKEPFQVSLNDLCISEDPLPESGRSVISPRFSEWDCTLLMETLITAACKDHLLDGQELSVELFSPGRLSRAKLDPCHTLFALASLQSESFFDSIFHKLGQSGYFDNLRETISPIDVEMALWVEAHAHVVNVLLEDDERLRLILEGRLSTSFLGRTRKTLDDLGNELGLTRERVRQVESKLRRDLFSEEGILYALKEIFLSDYGCLFSIHGIREFWTRPILGFEFGLGELALWGSQLTLIQDGQWFVDKKLVDLLLKLPAGGDSDDLAVKIGLYPVEDFERRLRDLEESWEGSFDCLEARRYLEHQSNYELREGFWVARNPHKVDRIAQVLFFADVPLEVEEFQEKLPDLSKRAIASGLNWGDEFVRVGAGRWALAGWGLETFTDLTSYIRGRIEEGGGRCSIEDIRQGAIERGLSANTVSTYMHSPDFRIEKGYLYLGDGQAINNKSPEESRNLVWRDGAWHLLLTVTSEHVRGSGWGGVPRGVIDIYGLEYDKPFSVPAFAGKLEDEVTFRWSRTGLNCSAIRWVCEDFGVEPNDRLWLRLDEEITFSVAPGVDASAEGYAALLNHLGIIPDPQRRARDQIKDALNLDKDAPWRKVVKRLYDRRDDEMAELARGL
ncbi:hypothetical protein CPHO_06840 [Corynebacterium phocae]|uniref:RNA polymerase sigma-70 region 4 domain-containing protein n=1 Tax=Corynebacterium phocae TaxID=161895 RepID=A0A1L7D3L0_9CORY|nr:hypothetical protein [Corynebacterium phocae]APT92657.1 hypothetical protein CPHO_06840 [Corynebacterium phocae]KAA8723710.1 hypothetical protein F4V58_06365 [Corynebacterium phocae]